MIVNIPVWMSDEASFHFIMLDKNDKTLKNTFPLKNC